MQKVQFSAPIVFEALYESSFEAYIGGAACHELVLVVEYRTNILRLEPAINNANSWK